MLKKLKRLKDLDEWVIAALIALIALDLILQVFCRFVLNRPLIWSEELARYLFVWAAMLGLGYNVRHGLNISMSIFVNLFPKLVQMLVQVAANLLVIVIYAVTLPAAIEFTAKQHQIMTAATQVPKSFLTVSVPIGFALLILQLGLQTVKTITGYIGERAKP